MRLGAQIMRRLLEHNSGAVAICRSVACLFHRCKTPPSISTRRAENWANPKVICQRQTRRLKRGGAQSLTQRPVQIFIGGAQELGPYFKHHNKEFSRLWNSRWKIVNTSSLSAYFLFDTADGMFYKSVKFFFEHIHCENTTATLRPTHSVKEHLQV